MKTLFSRMTWYGISYLNVSDSFNLNGFDIYVEQNYAVKTKNKGIFSERIQDAAVNELFQKYPRIF